MITFKSHDDLSKLAPTDPAYAVMKELVEELIDAYTAPGCIYDADAYGYCVLLRSRLFLECPLWVDSIKLTHEHQLLGQTSPSASYLITAASGRTQSFQKTASEHCQLLL